jgi:hypothetical protein
VAVAAPVRSGHTDLMVCSKDGLLDHLVGTHE